MVYFLIFQTISQKGFAKFQEEPKMKIFLTT